MSESSRRHDRGDRIGRTIAEQRVRAEKRLDGLATAAVGKTFGAACPPGAGDFSPSLARMVARDLLALGLAVGDAIDAAFPGGVWLAPAPDRRGVIVTWAQHEGSATAFGVRMHCEFQRHMNLILFEILHTLGYAVERYGGGDAHLITRFRPPLDG